MSLLGFIIFLHIVIIAWAFASLESRTRSAKIVREKSKPKLSPEEEWDLEQDLEYYQMKNQKPAKKETELTDFSKKFSLEDYEKLKDQLID